MFECRLEAGCGCSIGLRGHVFDDHTAYARCIWCELMDDVVWDVQDHLHKAILMPVVCAARSQIWRGEGDRGGEPAARSTGGCKQDACTTFWSAALPIKSGADRRAEALRDRRSQSASLGAVEPGLEHEDVPEVEVPVSCTRLVFLPFLADGGGVEVAFSFESGFAEEVFGPVAQGAS